jgi:hypothetical protein
LCALELLQKMVLNETYQITGGWHCVAGNSNKMRPSMQSEQVASPYLTTDGAVAYLGGLMGRRHFERLRREGNGPKYSKVGRRPLYTREWLDQWVSSAVCENTAQGKVLDQGRSRQSASKRIAA